MASRADYKFFGKLYESANSLVFRGERRRDGLPVILKCLKHDFPRPSELVRHQREYEITASIDHPAVIRVLEQFHHDGVPVMALEDFGGTSLAARMATRPLEPSEALRLGIRIAEALAGIHERHIIHKDINPGNIVYEPSTDTLKIIDFGIATRLAQQTTLFTNLEQLEGTVAYISPEQTGRMNRALDYRTDFYSLGVTLYEMLGGRLPFLGDDIHKLVHSHIALHPPPLHEFNAAVPPLLSAIVAKLMAKRAEDRYASGWGVVADLRACLDALERGESSPTFPLAQHDAPIRLEIPQKLYGRSDAVRMLLEAFGRVRQSSARALFVCGYSGIGKTSLVQEIHQPITLTRGYYSSGKFDQLATTPYCALSVALAGLVRQLLTESEVVLDRWRQQLIRALGVDAQAIIEIVPSLVKIIGPQRPLDELGATETALRLKRMLTAFLRVFCQPDHPVVLFIDDLQWADTLSLDLLESILCEGEIRSLLVVGAYRNNEVDALHPLSTLCGTLRKADIYDELSLIDLSETHLRELLADTLAQDVEQVRELAAAIKHKTGGNPFFVRQLLHAMYEAGHLHFDRGSEQGRPRWRWRLEGLDELGITDNVVDLLITKLRQLPTDTQSIVQLAACLGNHFELETLAIIGELPLDEVQRRISPAVEAGFVIPRSEAQVSEATGGGVVLLVMDYAFLHDRVQQAAYALAPEQRRRALHAGIGQLLLARLDPAELTERVFDLVHHLNRGEAPATRSARVQLAELNLEAARRAKQATAFDASREYIEAAAEIVPPDLWDTNYALAVEISTMRIELAFIGSRFEQSETLAAATLPKIDNLVERGRIHCIIINQRCQTGEYAAALDLGLDALDALGVVFSREDPGARLVPEYQQIMAALEQRGGVDGLKHIPNCEVPEQQLIFLLLSALIAPAYEMGSSLMTAASSRIILSTFEYGLHPEATMGFSAYAIYMGMAFHQYTLGYQMGEFAFEIAARFSDRRQLCRAANVMVAFIAPWARDYGPSEALVSKGLQAGIEVGELQYTSYLIVHHAVNCWAGGEALDQLATRISNYAAHLRRSKTYISTLQLRGLELALRDARSGADASEEQEFIRSQGGQTDMPLCQFEIMKARLRYIDQAYDEAFALIEAARQKLAYIPGTSSLGDYYHFRCLVIIARGKQVDGGAWAELPELLERLEIYASHCPANFAHKLALVRAELARTEGRSWDAMESYDRAIELAKASSLAHDEAIAQVRASLFWAARGKAHIAESYLREGHRAFARWGATRIVTELEQAHPRLADRERHAGQAARSVTTTSSRALDIDTVIRASRALADAIELEPLMTTVMQICLESAGASRGALVLAREGELMVKARGDWTESVQVELLSTEVDTAEDLSPGIVRYVARTGETVVLDDACTVGDFVEDAYVRRMGVRSLLCVPIVNQGSIIAVVFLVSPSVSGAFTRERVDIVRLLMAPAAMAIENMLLKHELDHGLEYQVGGTLSLDSRTYVVRRADRELAHALTVGQPCYVLCPRQMGKSSLRVRTMRGLVEQGRLCVSIDLSVIGSRQSSAEQWYAGICRSLLADLGLGNAIDLRSWWRGHDHLSPSHRLATLLEHEVLPRVDYNLVIFFDEIDSVLSLGFDYDDLFAMLRGFYNRRVDNPRLAGLTFVLLGVASPTELVADITRTPFNVGRGIALEPFSLLESKRLALGFADTREPEMILASVLAWTGGQPFLTQRVCKLLSSLESRPSPGRESDWVGRAVRARVIARWEEQDEPIHLRTIQERLLRSPRRAALLQLYGDILAAPEGVHANGDPMQTELLLSGIVTRSRGALRVTCRIYEEVFSSPWVTAHRTETAS